MPRVASLLLVLATLAACRTAPRPSAAAAAPAALAPIRFAADASIFPARWHRPAVDVRATALPPGRRAEAQAWATAALAKYPDGFLAREITSIHLLGALSFRGVEAGGSNSRRRVYVVVPAGRAARAYFERVVHAEISSVLLRRHRDRLDRADWLRGTMPGFRYGASGAAAVRHGLAHTWPTAWALKQGFLYEYGMSSIENDVNAYAGFVFTHPDRLAGFAARHAGVAHKRRAILAFYRALDPRFVSLGTG